MNEFNACKKGLQTATISLLTALTTQAVLMSATLVIGMFLL